MIICQDQSHLRLHHGKQVLPLELEVHEGIRAVKDGGVQRFSAQLAPSTSSIIQLHKKKRAKLCVLLKSIKILY